MEDYIKVFCALMYLLGVLYTMYLLYKAGSPKYREDDND